MTRSTRTIPPVALPTREPFRALRPGQTVAMTA